MEDIMIRRKRKERNSSSPFPLGRLFVTPGVMEKLPVIEVNRAISRHVRGDWGDVCEEDWNENNRALENQLRLVSVYHTKQGVKFYVITEWDRSYTTILLPEEY